MATVLNSPLAPADVEHVAPLEVLLGKDEGLPSRSVVNVDDITTIPKFLIKGRIAVLSAERMQHIEDAIRFALDLP